MSKSGKLYVLLGRSAVGKSKIEKQLHDYGLLQVVSCTTRPIREGEANGKDYWYLSEQEFLKLKEHNLLLEDSSYRGWYYGIRKDDIDLSKGNHVCVCEPKGFQQLKNKLGNDNVVGIYIYLNNHWDLLMRALNRQKNADIATVKEICRRYLSDFDTFSENLVEDCEFKIENINMNETVNCILRYIINN